jgi:AcrR family transcriptional regulator
LRCFVNSRIHILMTTKKRQAGGRHSERTEPTNDVTANSARRAGQDAGSGSGTGAPGARRGVRGGGEATRRAILEAAREQFSTRGYEHVGLREIAAAAGATAALVNRYFGTKEQLFRAVLDSGKPYFFERLLADHADFGEAVARIIVYGDQRSDGRGGASAGHAPDNVSYIVHSLGSPTVMVMLRELLDEELVPRLADWLGGRDARLRAEAVFACFLGVHALQQVVRTAALEGADPERLVAVLAPMLQASVDAGTAPAATPPAKSRRLPRAGMPARAPRKGR